MTVSLDPTHPTTSLIDRSKIEKFITDGGLQISTKKHLTLRDFVVSELIDIIDEHKDATSDQILVEALKIISIISNQETTDFRPLLPQLLQAFTEIKTNLKNKAAQDKSLALSQICLFYNKQFNLTLGESLGEKKTDDPTNSNYSIEIKSFAFFNEVFRRVKKLNDDTALNKKSEYIDLVRVVFQNQKHQKNGHRVLELTPHENDYIKEILKFEKAFELYSNAFFHLSSTISKDFAVITTASPGPQTTSNLQKLSKEISVAKLYFQLLKQITTQKIKFSTENKPMDTDKIRKQNESLFAEFKERKEAQTLSIFAHYPQEKHAEIKSLVDGIFEKLDPFFVAISGSNNGRDIATNIIRRVFTDLINGIEERAKEAKNNFEILKKSLVDVMKEAQDAHKHPILRAILQKDGPEPLPHRKPNPEKNKLETDFFSVGNLALETLSQNVQDLLNQHRSAGQSDVDFYRTLEEWDNIETGDSLSPPKAASTKQMHPPKIKQKAKPAAKTVEKSPENKAPVKSDTAAFFDNLQNYSAQDLLHQSMSILAQNVQLNETSAVAKEVQSHFFMAGASLELITSLLIEKDISSLGTLVPMHLLDCHIMIEQMATLELMKRGLDSVHSHSLVQLLKEAELWDQLDIRAGVFMRNIDQGLIWTRYLGSSIRKTRGELPLGLAQLSACFELLEQKQISKAKLQSLISFVVHVHYNSLKFISARLGWDAETSKIIELYSEKGVIEQKLNSIIAEFTENDLMATAPKPTPEQQQILSIYEKIRRVTKKMTTGTTEENHLREILKDIQFHLLRMSQSVELSKKVEKPYFASLFARNLMNMQWVFEQLYGARFLLKNHFATNIHEFKTFQLLLGDNYQQKTTKRLNSPETIAKFNFGLSGHYPHKKPALEGCDLAAAIESDRAQFLVPENFKPIGKKSKQSAHASKTLLVQLQDDFAGGITQVSHLLQDLIREGALDIAGQDMIRV